MTQSGLHPEFSDAHAEGLHDDIPRDGCPECVEQGKARPLPEPKPREDADAS